MKTTPFINKGMVKDLSISKVSNEFAYENFNIRIETKGENSLMSCTNERGNEPVTLYKEVLLNGVTVDFVSGTIADVHIQLDSPSDVPLSFNFKGTILEMPAGESECVICGKLNERSSFTIIQPENSIYLFYDKALPKPSEESYAQIELEGEYLGHCALSPYLVLFTHEENTDRIYRIKEQDDRFYCRLLCQLNLDFDLQHPIETIPYYEAEDIQKVYWTDGKNQPRVINIVSNKVYTKDSSFDFVTTFQHGLELEVEKRHDGSGVFSAGAVQYVATYYNKYGQETNAAYVSPLYYVSDSDRGNSPEETVTCSFRLSAVNIDTSFDFIRIYSITYTSEGLVSAAYIVGDISIESKDNVVVDNGTRNRGIDPTKILYLGGKEISAYTFSHKDNTLFLGNLKSLSEKNLSLVGSILRENCINENGWESDVIKFEYSSVDDSIPEEFTGASLYEYTNQLEYSSRQIKTFKGGEKYRFGLQFFTETGNSSRAFWIGDKINPLYPEYDSASKVIKRAIAALNSELVENVLWYNKVKELLSEAGYTKVRIVIAEANESDRLVKTQGVISPTVFNLRQRVNNQPYSAASWYMRPRGTSMSSRHFEDVNPITGSYKNWYDFTSDAATKIYFPDELRNAEIQLYDQQGSPFVDNTPMDAQETQEHQQLPTDRRNPDVIVCRLYVRRWKKDGKYKWKVYVARYHGWFVDTDYVWETQWQNNRQPVDASVVTQSGVENTAAAKFASDYRYCWQSTEYDAPKRSYKKAFIPALRDIVGLTENEISQFSWDTVSASGGYYDDSNGSPEYRMYDVFPIQGGVFEDMSDHPVLQAAVFTNSNSAHFFVDESIVTMNSPELENSPTFKTDGCKFRLVGASPLTANTVDYTMDISMGRDNSCQKMSYSFNSISPEDLTGLLAFPLYRDSNMADRELWRFGEHSGEKIEEQNQQHQKAVEQYYIYPWHKEGSVIGWREAYIVEASDETPGDTTETLSKLNSKIEATRRFAAPTKFFTKNGEFVFWSPNDYDASSDIEIKPFTSDSAQVSVMHIGSAETKLYQGNYDSLIISSMSNGYPLYCVDGNIPIEDKEAIGSASPHSYINSKQSVRIAYKSSPHLAIYLGKRDVLGTSYEILLPSLYDDEFSDEYEDLTDKVLPWKQTSGSSVYVGHFKQDDISDFADGNDESPYWFIGELYREPDAENDFGGTSNDALSKNTFVPASEIVTFEDFMGVKAKEGDSYYQRWDCIKTYPYATDYTNSIVDIASIMVESHINLAGRYDKRRGMLEIATTSPTNTGMINGAYTQSQSMFASISDTAVKSATDFPNQITWTLTKSPAALVDEWTHISLANVLDMDGDKGEIEAIRRFSNALYCFQDKGISEILFNSRTQISTQQGVPIEIANSGKVEGKRYLAEHVGCINKWSIIETATGIYFVDDLNKNICVLGQGIQNLSMQKGFDDWTKAHTTNKKWEPGIFSNITSMYDRQLGDIYLIGKDFCLCYNEGLAQFTSFYSYESTPMMTLLNDKLLAYKNGSVWKQGTGEYNMFYGVHKPYYMEYRVTPEPYGDKTFTNIEYRADMWNGDTVDTKATFDTLEVSTEYQHGLDRLDWKKAMPANTQKKFRIWRAFIPRDDNDSRRLNRIRNPWMKMRLTKDTENDTERMEFHNLLVSYIE